MTAYFGEIRAAYRLHTTRFNAHTHPEPFTDVAGLVKLLITLHG